LPANISHASQHTVSTLNLYMPLLSLIECCCYFLYSFQLLVAFICIACFCSVHRFAVVCVFIFSSRNEEISVSVAWVLMNHGVMLYVLPRFLLLFWMNCAFVVKFHSLWLVSCDASLWLVFVVVLDSNGKSRGYGFVRFASETDQQTALIEMQGYSGVNKKPLRISLATPKRSVWLNILLPFHCVECSICQLYLLSISHLEIAFSQ